MSEFLMFTSWGLILSAISPLGGGAMALVTLLYGLIFNNWALCGFSVYLYLARHEL